MRAAQGSAGLADACRAYLAAIGPPAEPALLSAFLDTGERELQRSALAALAEGIAARGLTLTAGLRAQIRTLAEGPDDELADAAEAVLR